MSSITVMGARGFIGSHLAAELRRRGHTVFAPARGEDIGGGDLGAVFYCIGLTADFRARPFDTVSAHICVLRDVLERCRFDKLVYLSSTRLYAGAASTSEDQSLVVNPVNGNDLYNLSKAMGESLAHSSDRPVRIVRLANVYGPDWSADNFLPSLIRAAVDERKVVLRIAPDSAKDHVSIGDVVDVLIRIAETGVHRVYNVASGRNVSAGELTDRLRDLCGCAVATVADAPSIIFPPISIARIQAEFGVVPQCVVADLPGLVRDYRAWKKVAA